MPISPARHNRPLEAASSEPTTTGTPEAGFVFGGLKAQAAGAGAPRFVGLRSSRA